MNGVESDQGPMPEKYAVSRRYQRAIVNLSAEILQGAADDDGRVDGRFLILGGGGAWIEMAGNYPIDSELGVRFELPPSHHIACRAVVRNRVVRRGAGVEFLDLSEDDRAKVIAFVEKKAPRKRPS